MKININSYNLITKDKSKYLEIEIQTTLPNGIERISKATINITSIGYFFNRNPKVVCSFLLFSSIVYAIDRSIERKRYSVDGWSREFDVNFLIPEAKTFTCNSTLINKILGFLTGDYWNCQFQETSVPVFSDYAEVNCFDEIKQVNLFSGGMDSLIGAIDFMATNIDGKVFLASHYDSKMGGPKSDQKRLLDQFQLKYKDKFACFPKETAVLIESSLSMETTCRSRSLLFIAIALQVSVHKNVPIIVPENGSVSLNYPLSVSRRSSCSTRTTHPIVLFELRQLLSCFDVPTEIINPYEFMTKGEMVNKCIDQEYLLQINHLSNSCGKRGRKQYFYDNPKATHCGRCMPCMYRKAALIGCEDRTLYGISLNTLFNMKSNKLSDDFYAMINFLKRDISEKDIRRELNIAGLGILPDISNYVDLVIRTRNELKQLINVEGHTNLKHFIGLI